jgi:alkaline phosphatase D
MRTQTFVFPLLFVTLGAFAQSDQSTTIAILGCHRQNDPAPALEFLSKTIKPDFAIWVGDNVYADTHDDASHIERQLKVLESKPGFKELREQVPFLVTWDDHDYGLNNAGADYPLKVQSKEVHRNFWRLENEILADQSGVYYAKQELLPNGNVIQFIMLDGRYNRGNPKDEDADALGEEQWEWLEGELTKHADLRFIVSGYQILLEEPTRWEAWVKVGESRKRLLDLLRKNNVSNAIFVTGDQHYVEVLESHRSLPLHTYEFMASGINQTERPGKARNRCAGPDLEKHSAPLIEITWSDDPVVRFINYHVTTGSIGLDKSIQLSQIKWRE